MAKPVKKVHLHEGDPTTFSDHRGNVTGALCERYKPESEVVPVQWFRTWVRGGYSTEFFCGDCVRSVEEPVAV